MLGRRYYRIKVLQALYGYFQGAEEKTERGEKELLKSIDKLYELYYLLFSFILEIHSFYGRRMEDARHKFYPSEAEVNPNKKFLDNRVIAMFEENKDLKQQFSRYRISWNDDQEMVRKVYQRIKDSKEHKDYLASGENSFRDDREFVYKILRKFIAKSDELRFWCEERYMHWYDDFDMAAALALKTLKLLPQKFTKSQALSSLFDKEVEDNPAEDQVFIRNLYRKTISKSNDYEQRISAKTKNWELERIALTDIILIKMALTEFQYCPTIPIKVTLNEYIEISKYFSTPKSKLFINGILDKLVEELKSENKVKKKGRGLI
jgi:N utilization substance protein B